MSPIRDLYQALVLEHSSRPRNFGDLKEASHRGEGHNPVCGDHLFVSLTVEDGRVAEVRFQGSGCAIAISSASLMTSAIKGNTPEVVRARALAFEKMMAGGVPDMDLGKPSVLAPVREFPTRIKCATLSWRTLLAALDQAQEAVTTEVDETSGTDAVGNAP
jgi:nitrogen fixation NifU-like protein